MGITRSDNHKRRLTGGRYNVHQKKKKYEMGRASAFTKLGPKSVHVVRVRGGNKKFRALRLDAGNFSWASEVVTRKTRVLDVVYNASNNELVRTKTLVKNAVIVIDATPFRQWYEQHYSVQMVKKGAKFEVNVVQPEKRGKSAQATYKRRQEERKLDPKLLEQFATGRLLACVSSRPGQCGRCDGYVLEGKELEFYQKKILIKKKGKA